MQFAEHGANFTPEAVNCVGCRVEGAHIGHCDVCTVRKCAMEKDVENCFVCTAFHDCATRKEFEKAGIDIAKNFSEVAK